MLVGFTTPMETRPFFASNLTRRTVISGRGRVLPARPLLMEVNKCISLLVVDSLGRQQS